MARIPLVLTENTCQGLTVNSAVRALQGLTILFLALLSVTKKESLSSLTPIFNVIKFFSSSVILGTNNLDHTFKVSPTMVGS